MSEELRINTADGVCEVQISRPKTKNSFLTTMYSEELLAHAKKRAAQLAKKPAGVVRATKALLKRELNEAIAERIDVEAEIFCKTLQEPPAQAAIKAFLNKKK
jgi:enoyl-CoA hydratase/carnithine racemase